MDVSVQVEILAAGGDPVFPGITLKVFHIYPRTAFSRIGLEHRPDIASAASDGL